LKFLAFCLKETKSSSSFSKVPSKGEGLGMRMLYPRSYAYFFKTERDESSDPFRTCWEGECLMASDDISKGCFPLGVKVISGRFE
jgi:hypothetical protein